MFLNVLRILASNVLEMFLNIILVLSVQLLFFIHKQPEARIHFIELAAAINNK